MAVYLGFFSTEYEARGGISDLEAVGRSLEIVRADIEPLIHVLFREAVEGRTISVEEQIAERERIAKQPMVTQTSDMRPVGSLKPIVIKARPRCVEAHDRGAILRVRFGGVTSSVVSVVDDGDWQFHFEWSDWTPIEIED